MGKVKRDHSKSEKKLWRGGKQFIGTMKGEMGKCASDLTVKNQ